MPPVGFEPIISAGEQPQTYALDRAPTGTGNSILYTDMYFAEVLFHYNVTGKVVFCRYINVLLVP